MTSMLHFSVRGLVMASLLTVSTALMAAERRPVKEPSPVDLAAAVDLFDAMDAKDVEVQLIPKDATEATVLITNKTKQPLTVRLPDAFAGVPVLAQRAGGGGRGGGAGNTGANQTMGGGMGGMGGGMMGGMGMMSIAPEKVAKFKVPTVCLEHGKKDPRPAVPYTMQRLESVSVTNQASVRELLVALGKQKLEQRSAQAAAWHLANEMSWGELANKRIVHLNGTSEPWFHPAEIRAGMELAHVARVAADVRAQAEPPARKALVADGATIVIEAADE